MPNMSDANGFAVVRETLSNAKRLFGTRLRSVYALGSLAHGGFSPLVSDVDVALILTDPIQDEDAATIQSICNEVKAIGWPLADRLSIFWGSASSLAGQAPGGRFPALDRLDLRLNGRLFFGDPLSDGVPAPSQRQLVLEAAEFGLKLLDQPDALREFTDPKFLLSKGARAVTKRILFPIRFLFTAATGELGQNEAAVKHFVSNHDGTVADLARRAISWREAPPCDNEETRAYLLGGIVDLYRLFLEDYIVRVEAFGDSTLAARLAERCGRLPTTETMRNL